MGIRFRLPFVPHKSQNTCLDRRQLLSFNKICYASTHFNTDPISITTCTVDEES
jgi:hypothetical protein